VANNAAGMPDFWRLFNRSPERTEIHVWAFDLLALNGKDLRRWSQKARKSRLQALDAHQGPIAIAASSSAKATGDTGSTPRAAECAIDRLHRYPRKPVMDVLAHLAQRRLKLFDSRLRITEHCL
jgi:hypothetical protein